MDRADAAPGAADTVTGTVPGILENSEFDDPKMVFVVDKPTGASWLTLRYFVSAPGARFDTKAPKPVIERKSFHLNITPLRNAC